MDKAMLILSVWLLTGCAAQQQLSQLPATHPASTAAASAPLYKRGQFLAPTQPVQPDQVQPVEPTPPPEHDH